MSTTPIGDILENLRASDLQISPALAQFQGTRFAGEEPPSNQQLLDAMNAFYASHQKVVDRSTLDTKNVAENHPKYVETMNSYNWKNQQLTQAEQDTTWAGIIGDSMWGPTLDDVTADQLFTTIGVGVSADLQVFLGGAGGLGCMWDIAKREGPKGYGYATGEAGLRVTTELNVQCLLLNQLPSKVSLNVYGLKISLDFGISISFQTFFMPPGLTVLGYAIGAGIGFMPGGATIFGGHVWNFG